MVAKAKVRIEGEDATAAAWKKAIGTAQGATHKISHLFESAFAGLSIAAIVEVGRESIKLGDELHKAAIKAGITGRAMSELNYVAKQSDVDLTSLSTGIKKMQVALSEAASGGKAQNEVLAALGLTIKDLKSLDADKQFEILGDRISQLRSPADRSRAAVELFGKAGADLLPLFAEGAEGIAKLRAESERLGAALSDEQINKLAAAEESVKSLEASWQGFAARMTSSIAPALKTALDFWAGGPGSIDQQIADLEDKLDNVTTNRGTSAQGQRAEISKKLAELRRQAVEQSKREMGVVDPNAKPEKAGPGFKDTAGAMKAEKTALDARIADEKRFQDSLEQTRKDNEELQKSFEDTADAAGDVWNEEIKQMGKDIEDLKIEVPLVRAVDTFRDAFMNAFDDMLNTGKFNWKELLSYMVAEFAKRGIANLFDSLFKKSGDGSSEGPGWGWLEKIGHVFGFADGGRPTPGVPYLVGERGPEVRIDGPGQIFPNHALGGGPNIIVNTHIDARGATTDLVKVLPKILDQHRKATIAEMIEGIRRNKYAL